MSNDSFSQRRPSVCGVPGRRRDRNQRRGTGAGVASSRQCQHPPWYEPNPGCPLSGIIFNRDLGSVGMSGGLRRVSSAAPAVAICMTLMNRSRSSRGRRPASSKAAGMALTDCATALAPRGALHYFINLSDRPMAINLGLCW